MTDLQTLFHNPECLSDKDLKSMYWKMRMQSTFPYVSAAIAGGAMFFMDTAILRKSMCQKRIGVMAFGGFMMGTALAYSVGGSSTNNYSDAAKDNFDKDIMGAFEERYVAKSLNAAGYGSNALNMGSHTKEPNARYKKPY